MTPYWARSASRRAKAIRRAVSSIARRRVKAFHDAGVANGGKSIEDPPGWREGPSRFYLAYLRDPSGNKVCALHRG
jgi:hypothetical protein